MQRAAVVAIAAAWTLTVSAQDGVPAVSWADILAQPDRWYGSAEARRTADTVLQYQRANGGWPKDIDMTRPPSDAPAERLEAGSTFDNGATTTQVRLLAKVFRHTRDARYADAVTRGVAYTLQAQYPNGGWPQVYPLESGYSRHITFNDNAMVSVLRVLDEVSNGAADLAFFPETTRTEARDAVRRGVDVILRAQVRIDGTLTAWCAQHDAATLEPRGARTYEHPSLSGMETVGLIRFLMTRDRSDARIGPAVDAAIRWLTAVKMSGWRLEQRPAPGTPRGWDRVLVADAGAPPLWARFYELGTNRPIFSGRDGVIKYRLEEIEYERRTGYAWVGDWPRALLETEYPGWRTKSPNPAP